VYSEWTPDNGQRNSPKHVDFYAKNKFVKLMHLVGFITKKFVTMHGHMNVKFVRFLLTSYLSKDLQQYALNGKVYILHIIGNV
jgi:hypothetical protein